MSEEQPPVSIRLEMEALSRDKVVIDAYVGDTIVLSGAANPRAPRSRRLFLDQLAQKVDVDRGELDDQIMLQGAELLRPPEIETEGTKAAGEALRGMDPDIVVEAQQRLESPGLLEWIIESRTHVGIVGEEQLFALLYLSSVSRLLSRPVNIILQGSSASGKSFPIKRTAAFTPPEAKVETTAFSQNSIFYVPASFFEHKLVVAGERKRVADEAEQMIRLVLRELISDGEVSKLVTIKEGGQLRTKRFHVRGPVAFQESTTLDDVFNEDANRTLIVHPDESQDQTNDILAAICQEEENATDSDHDIRSHLVSVHHAAQRLLKPLPLVFPGASQLLAGLPTGNLEARRLYPHLLSVAKASVILHQYQRQTDEHGRLVVDEADAELARILVQPIVLERLKGDLSKATRAFLDWLLQWVNGSFNRPDVDTKGQADGVTRGQIEHHLPKLVKAGYVTVVSERAGSRGATYRLADATEGA